jgi:hypothetical protein
MMKARARDKSWLIEALKDVSWFPAIFSTIVGAPSLLSLLEMVRDYRLSAAFQWIVDGYHRITAVMARVIEPLVTTAIAWINAQLGWHLVLYPHWRPLFLLTMVLIVGAARVILSEEWRATGYKTNLGLDFGACAIGALIGALLAGLVPVDGGAWQQGLLAIPPLTVPGLYLIRLYFADDVRDVEFFRWDLEAFLLGGTLAAGIGIIAASLSFVPGFAKSAAIDTLAVFVAAIGLWLFIGGLRSSVRMDMRAGLNILGGFIVAGMIVGADAIIKFSG